MVQEATAHEYAMRSEENYPAGRAEKLACASLVLPPLRGRGTRGLEKQLGSENILLIAFMCIADYPIAATL
ncbi:hypothetical protein HED49_09055 [Ochrobactrum daejeonense]|nr:hypothetical protein [Brucella daejeonensis]